MLSQNRCLKTAIILVALLAAGLTQPRTANAGIVADVWWGLFGPPGTPYYGYSTGYGPGYYNGGYYGTYTTNYAPFGSIFPQPAYYQPSYSPCNSCNPCCPSPCSPCSSCGNGGPCQVGCSNGSGPQTYRKTIGDIQPPKPEIDDSQFDSRDGTKKFEKTRPEVKEGDPAPRPGAELGKPAPVIPDGNTGTREALKPTGEAPGEKGPVIKQKKPVPPKAPVEGKKTEVKMARAIDRVNFDRKITWRPAVERTRLIIRPVIKSESLARTTPKRNTNWKTAPKSTQIVKK